MGSNTISYAFDSLRTCSPFGIVLYTFVMFFFVWGVIDIIWHIWIGMIHKKAKITQDRDTNDLTTLIQ